MGVTDPNGDPYSEAATLEDWISPTDFSADYHADEVDAGEAYPFEVEDDHLEGLDPPTLAVAIRRADGESEVLAVVKEPLAGEWQLAGPGSGLDE